MGGVTEQQVGEGVGVLFRRAPENGQVFLGDAVLRHGGGELAGDIPAAGEQHDAAHRLIETVDGGDIVVLAQGAVVPPQQGGHTGGSVTVLGQYTHGLDAEDEEFVLVQDTQVFHGLVSGGGHGRRADGSPCWTCRSGGRGRRA